MSEDIKHCSKVRYQHEEDIPPELSKTKKAGDYFCPYDETYIKFKKDDEDASIRKCPICGISDRDFYVRMINGLWGDMRKKRKTKKK